MERPADRRTARRWPGAPLIGPLVLLLGATPVASQSIVVGPPDLSVAPGAQIEVPIDVDMTEAQGLNLASLQFELSWNTAQFTYVSASGTAPSGWTVILNEDQRASGVIGVGLFSATGTTVSFAAVTVVLEAADAEGQWCCAYVNVSAAGDELGNSLLSSVSARSRPICIGITGMLGDVNDDQAVNIIDAQQVARYSIGLATPNAPKMEDVCDATEDGVCNVIDAQQVARHAVDLPTPNAPNIGVTFPGCEGDAPSCGAVISGTLTLSDAMLTSEAPTATAAAPAGLTPTGPGGRKPVPAMTRELQASRPHGSAARDVEIPTDMLIVNFRQAPLSAPPIGSAAMADLSTARTVAAAIRGRLESSSPVRAGEAEVLGVSPVILAARLRVRDVSRIDAIAAALRTDPAVRRVRRRVLSYWRDREPMPAAPSPAEPDDDRYEWQAWHYDMIDLPEAWDITTGSASVLVAVVDGGVRFDHPDLAANLTDDGYDFVPSDTLDLCGGGTFDNAGDGDGYDADPTDPADYEWDEDAQCATPMDVGSHGSHVAGTIGAVGNDGAGVSGVNWTVRIRPVRVLSVTGSADPYDVAQGILYAAGLPAEDRTGSVVVQAPSAARVINVSLGGPGPDENLENAIISAHNAGTLIVAAAGNSASSGPNYPSDYPETISVSAVGPDTTLASYSNFGPNVDIAAPGGDFQDGIDLFGSSALALTFGVLSTLWDFSTSTPTWGFYQGTSMAAPHVSGVAALLLAQDPSLTTEQLRARLLDYAVDIGTPGWDEQYGAGFLNARNSLTQSLAPQRDLYVRLYDAGTGAMEATQLVQADGSYRFSGLADGDYLVFGGQDANGDQLLGTPGRRWGAHGGSANPSTITVSGAGNYPASFTVGYPVEAEPNDDDPEANALVVGGYLNGAIGASDADVMRVVIPQAGEYTFETSAPNGSCGWAGNEDTILDLYDSTFTQIEHDDDIDYTGHNYCSRITATLQPGVYYLAVTGWIEMGLPYRVEVRSGG